MLKKIPKLFTCSILLLRWFLIFIIYYDFTLARRLLIILIKLVFALYDYPSLANEKCAQL